MTQNKRIVLNIIATYGRSVYAMVLGIFTARWVLEALSIRRSMRFSSSAFLSDNSHSGKVCRMPSIQSASSLSAKSSSDRSSAARELRNDSIVAPK